MKKRNAWLIRATIKDIDKYQEFIDNSYIATGYDETRSLKHRTKADIKNILSREPFNLSSIELGSVTASLNNFVHGIDINDIVLIISGDKICFGEVQSDYIYKGTASDCKHRRMFRTMRFLSREDLPIYIRTALKVRRNVADLTKYADELEAIMFHEEEEYYAKQKLTADINISYPLRPDYNINFKIPADINKTEAERLSDFFKTLYFKTTVDTNKI